MRAALFGSFYNYTARRARYAQKARRVAQRERRGDTNFTREALFYEQPRRHARLHEVFHFRMKRSWKLRGE